MNPTPAPASNVPTGLSDAEYTRRAHAALAGIESTIDRWLDEDVIDIDTHRTGGLLELSFPGGSKIILNTQPPLQELWMAARAGGFHYRWVRGAWRDTRSGEEFFAALSLQASAQGGQALVFAAPQPQG
jgi:CyaY protein